MGTCTSDKIEGICLTSARNTQKPEVGNKKRGRQKSRKCQSESSACLYRAYYLHVEEEEEEEGLLVGMALLMAVRLIRSSQVLASFRRTHVLKLSLPRELHMLFPSHSTHSQAFLIIIMQHKRLARTKLFVTRWHCNDPKKGMTNGQCIAMHWVGRAQESYWRQSGLQIQACIVITCFIS